MALTFDPHRLKSLALPPSIHTYGPQEVMLYALGLGLGHDPLDPAQLRFVYERGLQVLPTFASVLGRVARWTHHPDAGVDYRGAVHGFHQVTLHRRLPVSGTVRAQWRVLDVVDKGPRTGAFVLSETTIHDTESETLVATIVDVVVCRFDGGKGGTGTALPPLHRLPSRAPEFVVDQPLLPQAALIYRLSGDENPLHCDPAYAAAAGFERPILHGLATCGMAGLAVLQALCGGDPARIRVIGCRFAAPVFPGETLRTEVWDEGATASFRTTVLERGVVVLTGGRVEFAD